MYLFSLKNMGHITATDLKIHNSTPYSFHYIFSSERDKKNIQIYYLTLVLTFTLYISALLYLLQTFIAGIKGN